MIVCNYTRAGGCPQSLHLLADASCFPARTLINGKRTPAQRQRTQVTLLTTFRRDTNASSAPHPNPPGVHVGSPALI